jgi:O-antigen ligase
VQPALLIALIATSYLLLAGAPMWTQGPIWFVAASAALVAPRRTFSFPAFTRELDLVLCVVLAGMLIQTVPLPVGIVTAISPDATAVRAATRLSARQADWIPLSIDEKATLQAASTFALGLVAFWIARGVFSTPGTTRQSCRWIGWMAAAFALVAIVQRTTQPGMLMGVVPEARNANPMGPFMNRNHFATWMLMASAANIGYLVAHLQIHRAYGQRWRVAMTQFLRSGALLSSTAALVSVTALLMVLSRSAAVGLGAAAVAGAWLGRARIRRNVTRLPVVLGGAGVIILLLAAFIDLDGWLIRIQQSLGTWQGIGEGAGRVTIWRESLPMIRDFWAAGTGAGTYGRAMMHYQQSYYWIGAMQGWAHFNNAHSQYLQFVTEGGLLLVLPSAAALILLARLGLRAIRSDKGEMFWVRVGAASGIAGLAVQAVWEVPLLMPANAILAGTLAGLMVYRRADR